MSQYGTRRRKSSVGMKRWATTVSWRTLWRAERDSTRQGEAYIKNKLLSSPQWCWCLEFSRISTVFLHSGSQCMSACIRITWLGVEGGDKIKNIFGLWTWFLGQSSYKTLGISWVIGASFLFITNPFWIITEFMLARHLSVGPKFQGKDWLQKKDQALD